MIAAALMDRRGSRGDSFRRRSSLGGVRNTCYLLSYCSTLREWYDKQCNRRNPGFRRVATPATAVQCSRCSRGGDSFRLDGKCSLLPCVAHPSENSKSRNTYCTLFEPAIPHFFCRTGSHISGMTSLFQRPFYFYEL